MKVQRVAAVEDGAAPGFDGAQCLTVEALQAFILGGDAARAQHHC